MISNGRDSELHRNVAAQRRVQHDILFIRNVHHHAIESSFLLEHLPIVVPKLSLRKIDFFPVPFSRINTVRSEKQFL